MKDPYEWLENLDDPRVREWALSMSREAEAKLSKLSAKIYPRILELMRRPILLQARVTERGYILLFRGNEYWVEFMGRDGSRRRIVGSRDLGSDAMIHQVYADRRGEKLAYFYSFAGLDEGVLRIIDLATGEKLDELKGSIGDIVWVDRDHYYYTRFYRSGCTPDGVPAPAERILLRSLGGGEEIVFGEGLKTSYLIGLDSSLDEQRVLITVSYGWMETSFYTGSLRDPSSWRRILRSNTPLRPVECRGNKCILLSYEDEGLGDLVEVNVESGEKRMLVEGDLPAKWALPLHEGILVSVMQDASEKLRLYSYEGRLTWGEEFEMPGSLYSPHSLGGEAVFIYTSFNTPYKLYRLSGDGLKPLMGGEASLNISVTHRWAVSRDGTKIHMFHVSKTGGRSSKVLIYGYGGFGIPLTPRFFPHILPFLEDGGVFVMANIRGGGEYGEKWHKAGMRHNKKKVFEDFASCIEALRKEGMRIVAMGSSNGGLLVGAMVAHYPELLDGAVIGYPVLDMLRFHKLYIGAAWIPEYGDPDKPEDREYLASYSPYHNLRGDARYPPILIHTGLNDDRVHPGHAFKFAAKLRDLGAPVLLRVETRSGHSGASYEVKAKEYADIMAFVYEVLDMSPKH